VLISSGDVTDPRVASLLNIHLTTARAATARGSAHALDLAALQSPDIRFWTIWEADTLLGVGALKTLSADHGEIKSMHTALAHRGRGMASAMLRHIIDSARAGRMTRLSLETGSWDYFEPARALYKRHGFMAGPPFADYTLDPNSIFMSLDIPLSSQ